MIKNKPTVIDIKVMLYSSNPLYNSYINMIIKNNHINSIAIPIKNTIIAQISPDIIVMLRAIIPIIVPIRKFVSLKKNILTRLLIAMRIEIKRQGRKKVCK